MKHLLPYLVSLSLFLVMGCSKKETVIDQPSINSVYFQSLTDSRIYPNVRVLMTNAVKEINNVTNNTISLRDGSPVGKTLSIGDILVADTSSIFPVGALRKIIKLETIGTKIVIHTSEASLNDVFQSGSIHIDDDLTTGVKGAGGGRKPAGPIDFSIKHTFNKNQNNEVTHYFGFY